MGRMPPTERELADLQAQVEAERTLERALGADGFDRDPEDETWEHGCSLERAES
jgi:hypothetical protein